jgi:xanthine dehydrogenase small subunit
MDLPDSTDAIRFVLDDAIVSVRDAPPTTTLLQYLRDSLGRTGTKEGCAEGDCGACTVLVGEVEGDRIAYRAVNSCIRFLPTLDGCEVVTVEQVADPGAAPHPVQQAMTDCHGSQCGFCTPGFVMSLLGLYLDNPQPSREDVVRALSGNLCRCTGYRPIVEAGCRMHRYPEPRRWSRDAVRDPARVERLRSLRRSAALRIAADPGFHAPVSLDAFASAREAEPDALLLAGCTDVGLWVTKDLRALPPLLYLGKVPELRRIARDEDGLTIGAAARLADASAAIVGLYPMLDELFDRFGSVPIRNSGTLCGNIANGSPIGDAMPVLIALGATVRLRKGAQTRTLALEDLYLAYRRTALLPGEFVESVTIPAPRPGCLVASYKVAKRHDQDISAVCIGIAVELRNGMVRAARIAFGGMGPIPQRAAGVEAALDGAPWTAAGIESAVTALAHDFEPIDDMRASAGYRRRVAGNLLRRFFLAHAGGGVPCRTDALLREFPP